jgi:hypothetical protein
LHSLSKSHPPYSEMGSVGSTARRLYNPIKLTRWYWYRKRAYDCSLDFTRPCPNHLHQFRNLQPSGWTTTGRKVAVRPVLGRGYLGGGIRRNPCSNSKSDVQRIPRPLGVTTVQADVSVFIVVYEASPLTVWILPAKKQRVVDCAPRYSSILRKSLQIGFLLSRPPSEGERAHQAL